MYNYRTVRLYQILELPSIFLLGNIFWYFHGRICILTKDDLYIGEKLKVLISKEDWAIIFLCFLERSVLNRDNLYIGEKLNVIISKDVN